LFNAVNDYLWGWNNIVWILLDAINKYPSYHIYPWCSAHLVSNFFQQTRNVALATVPGSLLESIKNNFAAMTIHGPAPYLLVSELLRSVFAHIHYTLCNAAPSCHTRTDILQETFQRTDHQHRKTDAHSNTGLKTWFHRTGAEAMETVFPSSQ
jgi:hypothetical protein